MAQNNQMGAMMAPPPAAPANPTAVNFQSDPSMRAQFKGFMSGLSAQRAPSMQAPMQSPMTAPLPMPAPMQNVDIFQAQPMQMQMGGAVPRQTMMGGKPHMLSYITPGEAAALSAMGGTGQRGPGGVPSFVYDEAGMGFSSSDSPSMGDASYDYSDAGYSFDDGDGDPDSTIGYNLYDSYGNPIGTGIKGNTIAGGTIKGIGTSFGDFGFGGGNDRDALSTLMAREAARQDAERITALGGMAEIEEGFGPYSKVTGTSQTPMDPTEFAISDVKSIRDSVDKAAAENNLLDTVFDFDTRSYGPDTRYDIDTSYTPSPISTPDQIKMQQSLAADARRDLDTLRTGPIGIPDEIQMRRDANAALNAMAPSTAGGSNFVAPSIPTMTDAERNQMARDELGIVDTGGYDAIPSSVQNQIQQNLSSLGQINELGAMGPDGSPVTSGIPRTEAGRTNRIADSGFGPGEIYDAAGSRQPADRQGFFDVLMDTITGRQFPTDAEINAGIDRAFDAQTTALLSGDKKKMAPKLGTQGAATRSALEQLAERATPSDRGGILGAITNFGANNAANMYNDIVNKGYEPVYDSRGQIVATRVPGTDILGRGSVEGRIPGNEFAPAGGGGRELSPAKIIEEEIKKISNPPMASYEQVAEKPDVAEQPVTDTTTTTPIPGLLRNLGFGYGQYRPVQGISSNLNSAADDFLNLLSGAAPRNFAKGGQVPRQTEIAGKPHMLSYITPGEAAALQAMGGSGASGPGGIPSFFYDEVGAVEDTTGSYGSGGQNQDFDGDGEPDTGGFSIGSGSGSDKDESYSLSTSQANALNEQAKKDKAARDAAMEQQRRAADAAQRGKNLQASIDRLNEMRQGVQAPQQGIMSGVADLLGFGSNQNLLSADLSQQGMGQQSMTPNTSVMGYGSPTGQIAEVGGLGSVVASRDPAQSGIAGTANVSTQRQGSGFSMPSLPSFSEVMDKVIGRTDTYDMSRMTSR